MEVGSVRSDAARSRRGSGSGRGGGFRAAAPGRRRRRGTGPTAGSADSARGAGLAPGAAGAAVGRGADDRGAARDRVRFVVRSPEADEAHVHGYDLLKPVRAGGSVRFSFEAEFDGQYEI